MLYKAYCGWPLVFAPAAEELELARKKGTYLSVNRFMTPTKKRTGGWGEGMPSPTAVP